MSRVRSLSVAVSAALLSALAAFLIAGAVARGGDGPHGGPAGEHRMADWWGPPSDVRAMLRQIAPANLKSYDQTLVGFGTRHTLSSQTDPVRGVGAAGTWIFTQLQQSAATSGGSMTVERQTFVQPPSPRIPVPTSITNVVATLRGTDPSAADRVYVVGAHYDSRVTDVLNFTSDAPGADADASGVAAMLELARVMASHPSKATIIFVAFDAAEQGQFGSSFFAATAKASGENIQAFLNMDTIGSSVGANGVRDPFEIRLFSEGIPSNVTPAQLAQLIANGGENDGASRQLARYIGETGANGATQMDIKQVWRRDRFSRAGDQIPFLNQGFSAVRFTEPNENYNHQAQDVRVENTVQFGDLPQFLDFDYLARVTRVVGSSLSALARSPRAPANARLVVTGPLSNDAEVRWNADPEADLVGYEIVWRESSRTNWTHVIKVGNVTDYTLVGLNKDNRQFGVRAIDQAGDRSPVAYAVPGS
jgi:peptidase M28-like protein